VRNVPSEGALWNVEMVRPQAGLAGLTDRGPPAACRAAGPVRALVVCSGQGVRAMSALLAARQRLRAWLEACASANLYVNLRSGETTR
jgi:hypothetical protein